MEEKGVSYTGRERSSEAYIAAGQRIVPMAHTTCCIEV
jgi:hypothetical protein